MAQAPRIEAIERALRLLAALADAGPAGATLADLASATGVNRSTAYRALATMRAEGFVAQANAIGEYRLGATAMSLGERFWAPQNLATALHPALVALSRRSNELVHLGVLVDDRVLYLDKVEPDRAIRVWSQVGRLVPAATTSLGRAILAAQGVTDAQLGAYLHQSSMSSERLREVIHATRTQGYALEIGENEAGVACLGVAILIDSSPVAAFSITMQTERMTQRRQRELVGIIRDVVPALLPDQLALALP